MMLDHVAFLSQQALAVAGMLVAPALLVGLVAAVLAAIAQTVTSLNDISLGTIPRLLAMGAAVALLMPWILSQLLAYFSQMLSDAGRLAGGG